MLAGHAVVFILDPEHAQLLPVLFRLGRFGRALANTGLDLRLVRGPVIAQKRLGLPDLARQFLVVAGTFSIQSARQLEL